MISHRPFALELEIRRLDVLYRQNLTPPLIIGVVSTLFVFSTWNQLSPWFLVPYFILFNSSTVLGAVATSRWNRYKDDLSSLAQLDKWERFLTLSCTFNGAMMGVMAWVLTLYLG